MAIVITIMAAVAAVAAVAVMTMVAAVMKQSAECDKRHRRTHDIVAMMRVSRCTRQCKHNQAGGCHDR